MAARVFFGARLMEPEAKYTLVGAVVLILLALLTASVVWLRSSGEGAEAQQYKIYFDEQSLEGLEPRSYVTMRGMRVGSVTGFEFSSNRPGAVEVFIAVEPSTPVRESTVATVDRHLLTGLATVRLVNPDEKSPLLSEAPPGERHPVIAEGESPIQQVSEGLTQLAERADATMQSINALLSPQNVESVTELLENLERLSQHAIGTLTKVEAAIGSLDKASNQVSALAASVSKDAGALTTRYQTLGAEATTSVRKISEAALRVSADVERLVERADDVLVQGDDELRATARSLRSAADALGAAAGRLRDPRQVILGPAEEALGPGEGGGR